MKNRLVLINSFDFGSTGNLCLYLKDHQEEGFGEPIFLVSNMRKNGRADFYLYDNASKISRYLLTKKNELYNSYGFCSKKLTRKALEFVTSKVDLSQERIIFSIHQIESSLFDLETIFEFADKHDCKIFFTLHDCWPFTGKCPHYAISGCNQWQDGGCKKCEFNKEFPVTKCKNLTKSFERKISLFNKHKNRLTFICPSKWIYDEINKSMLSNIEKVVINNGIELSDFDSNNSSVDNRIGLIAVASPWTDNKGLKHLYYIGEHIDSEKYKLTVVGLDNGVQIPNAECFTRLEREKLFELYHQNDYLLNPTLEDNFPTVNIEALACGLKIISFKTGGSCEIFDNKTGYAVERGNNEELLKIINSLSKNKDRNRCSERAIKLFSKDKFIEMYYNLFKLC